jgi:hypothetical protein
VASKAGGGRIIQFKEISLITLKAIKRSELSLAFEVVRFY